MNHRLPVFLAAALALACAVPPSGAGWGGGDPVGVAVRNDGYTGYQNVQGWHYFYSNGKLIGCLNPDNGDWYRWEGDQWGSPAPEAATPHFGVMEEQRNGHKGIWLKDRQITLRQAEKALLTGSLTDTSKKLRMVVIGDDDEREPVDKAYNKQPKEWREHVIYQSVRPDHWWLYDRVTGEPRFDLTGHPTVQLTRGDGGVLWRQQTAPTAQEWQAILKVNPDYDPDKDPGPSKAGVGLELGFPVLGLLLVIVLAAVAFALPRRK